MQKFNEELTILTVEDNPSDLYLLEHLLKGSALGIKGLFSSDRVTEAFGILETEEIDIVLLDLSLPDSCGIQTFLSIRPAVRDIPVIILTGLQDTSVALEAIKEGAQDYLVKGEFNENLLVKSIQYSIERKRNLVRLWESNERFNVVTKVTNDAIWDWDLLTGKMFLVGDAFKRIFGYDVVDAVGPEDLWESSLHPDDRARVMEKLGKVIKDGGVISWDDEYRLKKSNGEYAYVHDRGYITYDPVNRKPVRMIGAMQDITARKKAEDIILASEEKYRQVFYKNPYPAWIYDIDTLNILEVNDSAIRKYGFDKAEFLRLTMKDLHSPEDAVEFLQALGSPETLESSADPVGSGILPGPERKLWRHYNKEGSVMIVEITSHQIDYFGKKAMQVIVNDLTERIRLEKELSMQQKLRQQQITGLVLNAQEKERAGLGKELHDNINQILATSKLYLDLAIEEEDPRMELLVKSRRNISMAIEEIRKLSKELISSSLSDLGLIQSIRELIRNIRSAKKMKIKLSLKGVKEELLKEEEKITIYRIIQEQLNNILKHAFASSVVIELYRTAGELYLSVKDDGRGFDTRVRRKGIGISNIISRAGLCNGRVEIESAPGKGCRIEVILPVKDQLVNR
ncbi:MAG: PAS domain S-box protein [Puia sp.]|nr:PAS domain S-box protein [Puia sp.]